MTRRRVFSLTQWIAIWTALLLPRWAHAQGQWHEGFESLEPSWQQLESDFRYRMEAHSRVRQGAHGGEWCERVRVAGDNGSFIYLGHSLSEARVINELEVRVWLRADRPGLQALARVVLPRTIDPATHRPAVVLVPGDSYTRVGVWQQLKVAELPKLVERQARVLRTTLGPDVDAREAFVDRIVLNVYGGPGVTNVWIDDLEVSGIISRQSVVRASGNDSTSVKLASVQETAPERLPATWEAASTGTSEGVPSVKVQGNTLMVDGKPFFPRMVPYHGEPLDRLKKLGFNTVKISALPSIELLEESNRIGMWLVAQPPPAADLTTRNAEGRLAKIGHDFDRVLAWDLGADLTARELDVIRPWIKALRNADPRNRPIVCHAESDLRSYSRYADILSVQRSPLGSSLELNEYGIWLRSRTQLARPGTPMWTTIQTQPGARLIEQMTLLSQGQPPQFNWQHEQLRLLTITALAAGMRGICFDSLTPLDANDSETQQRASVLEWLNLELDLINPWTSGGSFVTTAECTDPHLVGVVLQTDRARLLLPLAIAPHNQFAIEHSGSGAVSFVVPGASEGNDAYELSPAGLRPLLRRRVTGGMRITLSDGDRTSPIVMTQDALVVSSLSRRVSQIGRRMFELQLINGAQNLAMVAEIDRKLASLGRAQPQDSKLLATARQRFNQSETIASTNDLPQAQERLRQGLLTLQQLERAQWTQAASAFASPTASPFAVNFQTLPEHWQFVAQLSRAPRGPSRLRGGDCESLDTMLAAGWKHLQHPQSGLATSVDLAPENPHSGKFSLHLKVTATDPKQKPEIVETPPMWITTAPLLVEAGEVVQITGFVRVPTAIEGSVDGLMILDSIAGDTMAERIRTTKDWQEFTLYRVAPQSGNLTITFALTGLGEAWLDDVSVQAVDRSAAGLAQATRLPAPGPWMPAARR